MIIVVSMRIITNLVNNKAVTSSETQWSEKEVN